jgi:hypothetical protein
MQRKGIRENLVMGIPSKIGVFNCFCREKLHAVVLDALTVLDIKIKTHQEVFPRNMFSF